MSETIEIKLKGYTLSETALTDLAAEFYGKVLTAAGDNSSVIEIEFRDQEIPNEGTIAAKTLSLQFLEGVKSFVKKRKKSDTQNE